VDETRVWLGKAAVNIQQNSVAVPTVLNTAILHLGIFDFSFMCCFLATLKVLLCN